MAITVDGSTPAAVDHVTSTALTAVTASFSPPAGSLVAVCVNISYFPGGTASVTVKDSLSNSYTAGPHAFDADSYEYSGIFTCYYASAPGSITVTATRTSGTNGELLEVVTQVLDGAASSQSGAASSSTSGTTGSTYDHSFTPTTPGSFVLVSVSVSGETGTWTPAGVTGIHQELDATDVCAGLTGYYQTPSSPPTPSAVTLGWTVSGSPSWSWSWAALEILPYTSTPVAEADAGGAADQVTAQITSIPVRLITAPRRAPGPPAPPVRAQVFTVPQGAAMPADTAAAAEAMTAGTVTVPLADAGGAADFTSGGIMPQDAGGRRRRDDRHRGRRSPV